MRNCRETVVHGLIQMEVDVPHAQFSNSSCAYSLIFIILTKSQYNLADSALPCRGEQLEESRRVTGNSDSQPMQMQCDVASLINDASKSSPPVANAPGRLGRVIVESRDVVTTTALLTYSFSQTS